MSAARGEAIRVAMDGCAPHLHAMVSGLPGVEATGFDDDMAHELRRFDVALVDIRGGHAQRLLPWRDRLQLEVVAVCDALEEAIEAARLGATDVLIAPVHPSQLGARLAMAVTPVVSERIPVGPHVLDLSHGHVETPEGTRSLSRSEQSVARLLVSHPGVHFTGAEVQEQALGYAPGARSRAGSQVFYRLRKKVEPDPDQPAWFHNTYGKGFRFEPPDPTAAQVQGNLGAEGVELVGRDGDRDALARRLQTSSVLLMGPGGVGKTALAWAAARAQPPGRWPGGVWMVSLRDAETEREVIDAVADALGIDGKNVLEALEERSTSLVVADDLDRLSTDALAWLGQLVGGRHRVLATSRRAVDIGAEPMRLDGLPMDAAATLFQLRVRQARFGRPLEASSDDVTGLVRHAAGLPLQLELLAVECRSRPVGTIARELSERPVTGMDDVVRRSWELLSTGAQAALRGLATFRGGFRWEDAADVVGDALNELSDSSLLDLRRGDRLDIQPPVRRFLDAMGPPSDAMARAHVTCIARRSDELLKQIWTAHRDEALAALKAERANLVVALSHAGERHDLPAWRRLALALDHVEQNRGRPQDRLERLDAAPPGGASPEIEVRRFVALAELERHSDAMDLAERLLAAPLGVEDRVFLLRECSRLAEHRSREAGEAYATEAVATADHGSVLWALALHRLANVRRLAGDLDGASEALGRTSEVDLPFEARADIVDAQAAVARDVGRMDEAILRAREARALASTLGGRRLSHAAYNLGAILHSAGATDEAIAEWRLARDVAAACGDLRTARRCLLGLAVVELDAGRPEEAHRRSMEVVGVSQMDSSVRAVSLVLVSLCLRHLDRVDEAVHWLRAAHAAAATAGQMEMLGYVAVHLASVLADAGLVDEAQETLARDGSPLIAHDVPGAEDFLGIAEGHIALAMEPDSARVRRRVVSMARHAHQHGTDDEIRRAAALLLHVASEGNEARPEAGLAARQHDG